MLTVALCPVCGQGVDLGVAGEKCPHCGAPLPEQLRAASRAALQRQRPILITLLMFFSFLCSIAWLASLAWAAVTSSTLYISGEQVTRGQFFLRVGPPLFVCGSLMLAAAYAFWKERSWGRPLICLCFVLLPILSWACSTFPVFTGVDMAMWMVYIAFLLGYFYAKPNVVRYYRYLRSLPRTGL